MVRSRRSSVAEAHEIYKKYHRHYDLGDGDGDGEGGVDDTDIFTAAEKKHHTDSTALALGGRDHRPLGDTFPMYHRVMKTGVIYATSRAAVRGFRADKEGSWAK